MDVPGRSWDVLTVINLQFKRILHGCPRTVLGGPYSYQVAIIIIECGMSLHSHGPMHIHASIILTISKNI